MIRISCLIGLRASKDSAVLLDLKQGNDSSYNYKFPSYSARLVLLRSQVILAASMPDSRGFSVLTSLCTPRVCIPRVLRFFAPGDGALAPIDGGVPTQHGRPIGLRIE